MTISPYQYPSLPASLSDTPHPLTLTPPNWDNYLLAQSGHLLQSWAWGELKRQFGWTPLRLQVGPAVAQVLFKQLPLGFTIAYLPKGPLVDWADPQQVQTLFTLIHNEAKKRRAIFLKIEPNLWRTTDTPESLLSSVPKTALNLLTQSGFISADTIQPQNTLLISLDGSEVDWLAAMKQKTRYNIRLAEKKGVTVRHGSAAEVSIFYQLAQITAARDGFGIHSLAYYQSAYHLFAPHHCALLLAEFEGRPLAALMAFAFGREAYYFYGASDNEGRPLMPTYLLQLAAMRWAKSQGCTHYDLWGIPDAAPDALEAEFEQRHDGLWGIYRFKRGFGGQWAQCLGAFDYVYNPLLYRLYRLRRHQ